MRILVVENELAARRGLVELLKGIDPRIEAVSEAANGAQGLVQFRALTPELAFVDIRMPDMDGLTAQSVIVTAYAEFKYAQNGLQLGARLPSQAYYAR